MPSDTKARPAVKKAGRASSLGHHTQASLTRAALWGLLACLALATLGNCLRPAGTSSGSSAPEPTEQVGPAGFAELYVATFVRAGQGSEATLRPFFGGDVDFYGIDPHPDLPVAVATIEVVPADPEYWSVLVAAVTDATTYYRVAVFRADGRFGASKLPQVEAAPLGAGRVSLGISGSTQRAVATDPVGVAATNFLRALLVGQGEVARYAAPGSGVEAVRPAPFVDLTLKTITSRPSTDPPGAELLVDIVAKRADGRREPLSYSLQLAQRDGRWEVTSLVGAPSLSDQKPAAPATAAVATTSSSPATSTSLRSTTTSTTKGTVR